MGCPAVHGLFRSTGAVPQYRGCPAVQGLSRTTGAVPRYRGCPAVQELSRSTGAVPQYRGCPAVQGLSRSTGAVSRYRGYPAVQGLSRSTGAAQLDSAVQLLITVSRLGQGILSSCSAPCRLLCVVCSLPATPCCCYCLQWLTNSPVDVE